MDPYRLPAAGRAEGSTLRYARRDEGSVGHAHIGHGDFALFALVRAVWAGKTLEPKALVVWSSPSRRIALAFDPTHS
jgi:hypothetical protein